MVVELTPVQLGTIVVALATLFGAAVGSSLQFYFKRIEKENRKRNLRIALLGELSSLNFIITEEGRDTSIVNAISTMEALSTDIYDANLQDIGMLTEGEVAALTTFYTCVKVDTVLLEDLKRLEQELEEADSDFAEEVNPEMPILEEHRRDAMDELRENL